MSHPDKNVHTPEIIDKPDSWHTHYADEHPQQAHAGAVNVPQVLTFGVFGFILVVVSVVATIIYFNWYSSGLLVRKGERADIYDNKVTRPDKPYTEYRSTKETEQDGFAWTDTDKNLVRIPIDQAKKKMAEGLAARK